MTLSSPHLPYLDSVCSIILTILLLEAYTQNTYIVFSSPLTNHQRESREQNYATTTHPLTVADLSNLGSESSND